MLKRLCVWWFNVKQFKMHHDVPDGIKQYVLVSAPHTSNWDFIYAIACFERLGIPVRFTIKQEWLKWPFGGLMRKLGAIGIDRSLRPDGTRPGHTEAMAKLFEDNEELVVLVTPEGTRSKRTKWKTGFYHVAVQANVPIVLSYLDYKKKEVGISGMFYPTGDIDADMNRIMNYYSTVTPRFPEKHSPDLRYV